MGNTKGAASSTLSRAIDAPPIELHFSGCYQFVELELHYKRGWKGETDILGWDKACRVCYIAY